MKKFSSETIKTEHLANGKLKLLQAFSYGKYTVKKGYIFDGASIPRAFWRFIGHPFSYKYIRSALIHDILCESEIIPREDTDKLFREMLAKDRIEKWKISLMFRAVRASAWWTNNEHSPEVARFALKHLKINENTD